MDPVELLFNLLLATFTAVIFAVALRKACQCARTSVPDFPRAMAIIYITLMLQVLISIQLIPVLSATIFEASGPNDLSTRLTVYGIGLLLSSPLVILLYKWMAPIASYGKAARVWLIQILILIPIAIIPGVAVLLIHLASDRL